ncbi:tRNA 2-thiouridine(34) synthase MnmA [Rickettsia prowazekii]|uniref:tRNA-specific 2-thiouridylase MnmA n=2 Tax=Rickettsia prowazekii TaxID=782 RepID=MNMA_RICPR|nr:tRNA 2-thiouridine(34) synthase MnmA [Rickettsia prowazekii]Q9ZDM1.1 RecName: Full=tRNA-specific 2-thiouridylase MnmA [Rickettsia prowazekii str. Madrid E]EOB09662.1 tRNA-specific 2-thiouridylase MnmA [Rickettsia prowazekii str. GvF12]ADE29821.1 tRNA(5-methylaminomethyl-2-thiouridylate)-methyltransferase [Rickettsia prowazekii str. Rp22]AFE49123.1 tRNA-specific 2-thiouridylase MnmA [Rickettsia prowazekii str. Chernikova]AFE49969.1 tRNA-specific 2-thiouridylase MnmA [Rickettsia prowazekii st
MATIVVAMSGGVDSSAVAAMLHEQGHNVIGITLQLYDYGIAVGKKNACCAGQDIYDAKMVANKLGIPHYVLDYENKFKESVIDNFVDSYLHGETPLPCVQCNKSVKFRDLINTAKELGADKLATGHYVRKINGYNGAELHTGLDTTKDQSYFLFTITREQLEYLSFPLGGFTKYETRKLASKFGLDIADKPDSQDICFVPDGNYKTVINKIRPEANTSGKIVHINGFELGEHSGIINYTIGQRRGLGIAYNEPLYVVKIDPSNNIVYVGQESALHVHEFIIKDVNWLADEIKDHEKLAVDVKIRSTRPPCHAEISKLCNDRIKVKFLSKEKAVAPGQACVIYAGERVLGGGWITSNIS